MLILLGTVSQQLAALGDSSSPNIPAPSTLPFTTSPSALRVNVYWFLSLSLSLTSALMATLIKQWTRNFTKQIEQHSTAYKRARIRAFLYSGMLWFKMEAVVEAVPTLLHISVALFFAGLYEFILPINRAISWVLLGCIITGAILYGMTVILPVFSLLCPFQTPLSHLCLLILHTPQILIGMFHSLRHRSMEDYHKARGVTLAALRVEKAMEEPGKTLRDDGALDWTMQRLNEDHELEPFIAGLPEFIISGQVNSGRSRLDRLIDGGLGYRIISMLDTCANFPVLDNEAQKRILSCLEVTCLSYERFSPYAIGLFQSLHGLLSREECLPILHARSSCTMALITHISLRNLEFLHLAPGSSYDKYRSSVDTPRSTYEITSALQALDPYPLSRITTQVINAESPSFELGQKIREARILLLIQVLHEYLENPEQMRYQTVREVLESWDQHPLHDGNEYEGDRAVQSLRDTPHSTQRGFVPGRPITITFKQHAAKIVEDLAASLKIPEFFRCARGISEGNDPLSTSRPSMPTPTPFSQGSPQIPVASSPIVETPSSYPHSASPFSQTQLQPPYRRTSSYEGRSSSYKFPTISLSPLPSSKSQFPTTTIPQGSYFGEQEEENSQGD